MYHEDYFRKQLPFQPENPQHCGPGPYYITICTNGHECNLAEIVNHRLILSPVGQITSVCWKGISDDYGNIVLDEFVIMPNHLHGIVRILENNLRKYSNDPDSADEHLPHKRPKEISIEKIIWNFKTKSSNFIRQEEYGGFQWKWSNYIYFIRNSADLYRIKNYIQTNPFNWNIDPDNI